MPTLQIPARPEVKFGVWDRNGNPVNQQNGRGGNVGFRIWPTYRGFNGIYRNRQEIPERHLEIEVAVYEQNLPSFMLKAIDIHEFLNGKQISSIRFLEGGGYPTLIITIEGKEGEIRLRGNRWNYSYHTAVTLPDSEGPWTVKRWLKTGKVIRLTDGKGINLTFYGRLRLQSIPDWFMNELYGINPAS